jgi:hypothetical protein
MSGQPDGDELDPMNVLDITEDTLQELHEKRQNALNMQADAAIRAILNGAPPAEIAARCGFKEEKVPPNSLQHYFGAKPLSAEECFGQWLASWLYKQIVGFGPEDQDGV